jgi:hypothetical protein
MPAPLRVLPHRRAGLPVLLVALLVAGLLAVWLRGGAAHPARPPAGVTLADLHGVADLQARFNADHGRTRLVVIFSPT